MIIKNGGQGACIGAAVTENHRLAVASTATSIGFRATQVGLSHSLDTSLVNLTSANESGVMYFKNNEDSDLVIEGIAVGTGASTGGVGDILVKIIKNPTGGTLISAATPLGTSTTNRNFGSSKTIVVDAYQGAEGATVTGGDLHVNFIGTSFLEITQVLPKGASIAITITPAPGNTSLNVLGGINCYVNKGIE